MLQIFGNATEGRPPVWKDPPAYRGSISIVWWCLTTLVLCIWSAVHPNLPGTPRARVLRWWHPKAWISEQHRRRCFWLLVGLCAPEVVSRQRPISCAMLRWLQIVFNAWTQRKSARELTILMTDRLSRCPDPQYDLEEGPSIEQGLTLSTNRRHAWTHAHSFFATSGGFVFDHTILPDVWDNRSVDRRERPLSIRDSRYATLDLSAVLAIATFDPSLIPDISKAAIQDKSKANPLVKAIVCLQAAWFLLGIILRLCDGLAISLLELNTFAHALCALFIYILWWDKPADVEMPIVIRDQRAAPIYLRLCLSSAYWVGNRIKREFLLYGGGYHGPVEAFRHIHAASIDERSALRDCVRRELDAQPMSQYDAERWEAITRVLSKKPRLKTRTSDAT